MPNSSPDRPAIYHIKVSGHLDQSWAAWLSGMAITCDRDSDGRLTTTLIGPVADQSALRGILSKIWDLNLVLISLNRVGMADNSSGVIAKRL